MKTIVYLNRQNQYEAGYDTEVPPDDIRYLAAYSNEYGIDILQEAQKIAEELNVLEDCVDLYNGRYTKECENCGGQGYVAVIIDCTKPLSVCCGGCTKDQECYDCDGSGTIKLDEDEVKPHITNSPAFLF